MTQEMNELTELLNRRLAVASEILNERLEKPPYVNIEGVSKLKNRLASEIRFLDGVKAGKQPMEKKFIETSNVTHFENIVKKVEEYEDVVALLRSFTIKNTDDDGDRNHFKHTVDFVAKNGNQWVKVISRSAKGICMDWLTCSTRNIFEQASDYIDMAQRFQRNFMPPEVVFDFISGVPDKIADKLRSKGVTVVGESIDINTLTKVPEDFLEMLEVSSDEEAEPEQPETKSLPPINLDVSAVFVLISNMTHENGTNHKFGSSLLKQQAGMEKTHKAKVELLRQIEGRDWIMCKTAFEAVHSIVGTVGGPSERLRCQQLLEKVRVVDDFLSERSQKLTLSDRVNERSRVIFGSGDHYKAVTATANKHFVSSAYHQGVSFHVFLHESRALSEQKELPLNSSLISAKNA